MWAATHARRVWRLKSWRDTRPRGAHLWRRRVMPPRRPVKPQSTYEVPGARAVVAGDQPPSVGPRALVAARSQS